MPKVNKIILGTAQMGLNYGVSNNFGKISKPDAFEILETAYKSGVLILDTAKAYGDAHQLIGDFHVKNPLTIFEVITKIPSIDTFENIEETVFKYLEELKVPHLYALMFHHFATYQLHHDIISDLKQIKINKKIKNIGISVYNNQEFEIAINDENIDLIQIPFNLLDNLSKRGPLLEYAKQKRKIIHSRSTFLQGLFFKDVNDDHVIVNKLKDQLVELQHISQISHISINELALAYCLSQKNIDKVLFGVDSLRHFKQNIASISTPLDEEIVKKIDNINTPNDNLLNPSQWHLEH